MPITSTWTDIADYILDQLWGFAGANVLKSNVQYLHERFAGDMEADASVAIGGFGISSSCGTYTTTSTSFVDVTNLSFQIQTSGRPIMLGFIPTTGSNPTGYFGVDDNSTGLQGCYLQILRDVTIVSQTALQAVFDGTIPELKIPASSFSFIDQPAAGTYTYKLQVRNAPAGINFRAQDVKMFGYEL